MTGGTTRVVVVGIAYWLFLDVLFLLLHDRIVFLVRFRRLVVLFLAGAHLLVALAGLDRCYGCLLVVFITLHNTAAALLAHRFLYTATIIVILIMLTIHDDGRSALAVGAAEDHVVVVVDVDAEEEDCVAARSRRASRYAGRGV